jgi:tellurite resistance-related uncharacterized protein
VSRALHPATSAGPLDPTTLERVVASIGDAFVTGGLDAEALLGPRAARDRSAHERSYAPLVATDDLELWLIEWGPSTFLDLHDHGGANGALRVLRGNLVETYTDLASRAPLHSRVLGGGDRVVFAPEHVHEIWNATGESALTLHGYSPRLSSMTFYEHDSSAFLAPLRTEAFEHAATGNVVELGAPR